jgi:beta-lactamase class A
MTTAAEVDRVAETVRRGDGVVSVVARVVGESAVRYALAPDETHYAASTMKLPVLLAALRREERGELDLDEDVEVHTAFASQAPGRTFEMDESEDSDPETWAAVGTVVPLRAVLHRMVTLSGNLATNLVLDRVGVAEVADVLAAAGCSSRTRIPRGIEDYPAREEAGLDNMVTADDLALVMVALAEGRLAGPAASAAAERILRAQTYRDGIPAGLPADLVIGNKTGWIDGVNHDVALVRRARGPAVALAVLCTAPGTPEEREAGIARIAAAVWALLEGHGSADPSTMSR